MASIGPRLPPHLHKRKRSSDDDVGPELAPSKAGRHPNDDAVALEEDSDGDGHVPLGRSAPMPRPPNPSIGPTLQRSPTNQDEIDLNDSDQDSNMGPDPASRPVGPSVQAPAKRIVGPTLPPAALDERPTAAANREDSDSDSDDYGPALPPTAAAGGGHASASTSYGSTKAMGPAPEPALKRDDWMLAPQASTGARAPDPTKLKARGFASGRAANARGSGEISSIWTETPEEKVRRLKDEVLGRGEASGAAATPRPRPAHASASGGGKVDDERIQSYTAQTRGRSLYEEHQVQRKASHKGAAGQDIEEEDDPSKRAFDKEKDMSLGGRISNSQRREMLNRAANFGGRFQKGNYL